MTKPKAAERIMPAQEQSKGIVIKDDAVTTVGDTLFEWLNLSLLEDKQKFKLGVLMSPQIGLI
ncbi:hypothetical protein H5410_003549 [Solanum commersonii]|uniref:Uncharacterized protein n=1 Tax=Solanum commersonii TaxID=4109 RepID=A0A9J6B5C3_SOLCO|nr:hypothetical protein H5410_003549 [Solanum commersonii]